MSSVLSHKLFYLAKNLLKRLIARKEEKGLKIFACYHCGKKGSFINILQHQETCQIKKSKKIFG